MSMQQGMSTQPSVGRFKNKTMYTPQLLPKKPAVTTNAVGSCTGETCLYYCVVGQSLAPQSNHGVLANGWRS
jgi:hypothetical protein